MYNWQYNPLFSNLDKSELNDLAAIIRNKKYKKGETIFFNSDTAMSIFIISSGSVKLCRETQDGHEAIIDICKSGDIFAENTLFGDKNYNYSAIALEDCETLILPLVELKMILASSEKLKLNSSKMLLKKQKIMQKNLEHLTVQSAPQRIGCFLLENAHKHEGSAILDMPFEKGLIASKLGMKPETFSRALNELKNFGVNVEGKKVHIKDIEVLSEYSCSACSDSFPCDDKVSC
jgi:CRP-like cAMP-binding protein